ncbi:MAG: FMN-binding negative transcriptional regulator [Acidimicrobiia bacterium]|nr:FMN-binding negative transcriptional regulator [Acidimicrobiia bacterium]
MYLPKHFAEPDLARLHDLIEGRVFGLLIVIRDGVPDMAHIPFVLDRGEGSQGTLRGHFARPNPIWRAFDGAAEARAIFSGPDTYISPDWYVSHHQVPTWNYIAVHAWGRPRVLEDAADVRRVLDDLSARNEARIPGKKPWTIDKLPAEVYDKMTKGIVAFAMPIDRIEGKWKLNQNRTEADRRGVIAQLEASDDPNARAIAAAMRAL